VRRVLAGNSTRRFNTSPRRHYKSQLYYIQIIALFKRPIVCRHHIQLQVHIVIQGKVS
jgi:hypothetical protein